MRHLDVSNPGHSITCRLPWPKATKNPATRGNGVSRERSEYSQITALRLPNGSGDGQEAVFQILVIHAHASESDIDEISITGSITGKGFLLNIQLDIRTDLLRKHFQRSGITDASFDVLGCSQCNQA